MKVGALGLIAAAVVVAMQAVESRAQMQAAVERNASEDLKLERNFALQTDLEMLNGNGGMRQKILHFSQLKMLKMKKQCPHQQQVVEVVEEPFFSLSTKKQSSFWKRHHSRQPYTCTCGELEALSQPKALHAWRCNL